MAQVTAGNNDFNPVGSILNGAQGNANSDDPLGRILGGSPTQYDDYSQVLASLSGTEFNQAQQLQNPALNYLQDYAENPNTIANARNSAIASANQQTGQVQGYQQRLLGQLGVNLTPAQQQAQGLANQLSAAKGQAGAANTAARQTYGLQQQILAS